MTDIAEITMSYKGLVDAGREARKQIDGHQWTQGGLALEVEALPGNERPRDPESGEWIEDDQKALKRYADDIDIPYSTVQEYRRTAEAWPSSARAEGVGWKVHNILASQQDRADLIYEGMTVREARKLVRKRRLASHHPPGWFEMLGEVAMSLEQAGKRLDRLEDAMTRGPNAGFRERAGEYAELADGVSARLRGIEQGE